MNVAGKLHPEPKSDVWRKRCDALSEEIHRLPDEVYGWWEQLWMCRRAELGWPVPLAKWQAFRDVRESLDRRGAEPD